MSLRRLALPFLLAVPATGALAQAGDAAFVAAPQSRSFRIPRGDYRPDPGPVRNGLIGTLPLAPNLQLAVGRFNVPELARPRTHMEADQRPTEIRRRDRGIAAIGLAFRF